MLVAVVALGAVVVPARLAWAADARCSDPAFLGQHMNDGVCTGAGGNSTITTFGGLLNRVNLVLNTIVPFLVGIAVFIVIWGVFKYIASAAEEEKRAEARAFIVWGIIGIFAMVSVWGFVNILVNSFDLSTQAPAARPNLPPIPGS